MNASSTSPAEGSASTERLAPEAFAERATSIEREIGRVIVGQRDLVRQTMTGLLANSHVLLEGVPGLGKTMLVRTIADVIDCSFNRIQFTPDLMPADITGTNILIEEGGSRVFRFQPGPIFANLVLADEINRATPKTQSSLLEAMQEHQVTVARQRFPLDPPFFVLATQNPLEMEGTYPLPEAQLDRFMFELRVGYPSKDEEERIVESTTGDVGASITPVLTAEDVLTLQHLVRRIPVPQPLVRAAVTLVRMTRPPDAEAPPFMKQFVSWGAGPRASQYLILGAKARAALDGRPMPDEDDLRAVAPTVLTHRLVINFAAEAAGRSAPDLVEELLVTKTWLQG